MPHHGLTHESTRSQTTTWLTPPEIIQALGPFDLDPCAAPSPRPWDTANEHWEERGLDRKWRGRVWLNPPYGSDLKNWLRRMAEHRKGIALTFARTETSAFHDFVWPFADSILFLRGRLYFYKPDGEKGGSSGAPSVLISYSERDTQKLIKYANNNTRGWLIQL